MVQQFQQLWRTGPSGAGIDFWTTPGCGTAVLPSVKLAVRAWKMDGRISVSLGLVQFFGPGFSSDCDAPAFHVFGSPRFKSMQCGDLLQYDWGLQNNHCWQDRFPLPSGCSALGLQCFPALLKHPVSRTCVLLHAHAVLAGQFQSFGVALSVSSFTFLAWQRGGGGGQGFCCASHPHVPSEPSVFIVLALIRTQQQRGGESGNCLRPPHVPSELRPGGVGIVLFSLACQVPMASVWVQQQRGGENGNDLRLPHVPSELRPGGMGSDAVQELLRQRLTVGFMLAWGTATQTGHCIFDPCDFACQVSIASEWVQQQRGGEYGNDLRLPHAPSELHPGGMGSGTVQELLRLRLTAVWMLAWCTVTQPGHCIFVPCSSAYQVPMASEWVQQQRGGELGNDLRPPHVPSELRPGGLGFCAAQRPLQQWLTAFWFATWRALTKPGRCSTVLCSSTHQVPMALEWVQQQRGGEQCNDLCPPHVPSELRPGVSGLGTVRGLLQQRHIACWAIAWCTLAQPGRCISGGSTFPFHDDAGFFQATCCQYTGPCDRLCADMLFFILHLDIRLGVCPDISISCNDFSTWHTAPICHCLSDLLTFSSIVGDAMPYQLAGGPSFLQRQILLPAVHLIGNLHVSLERSCVPCAAFSLLWRQSRGYFVTVDDARCGHDTGFFEILATQRIFFVFMRDRLWQLILHLGALTVQFFQTLLAVTCAYFVKLICFALGLRGGRYNADNLLRIARGATAGIPLEMGLVLHGNMHSELLAGSSQSMSSSRSRCLNPLWLTLLVLAFCASPVAAARGLPTCDIHPQFQVVPPQPLQQGVEHAPVFQLPEAAQQTDSETESDSEDSESSVASSLGSDRDVLFKVYGFGYVPEHHPVQLNSRTPLYRALELIAPGTQVAIRSSKGRYVPLMGMPIDETYATLWVPDWIEYTSKRLAVLDATHVSWETSVLVFERSIITLDAISQMLEAIWQPHWVVFIPARHHGPLTIASCVSINNGDVIFVSPDAFCPFFHDNSVAAFGTYEDWGVDPGLDGYPDDLPGGPCFAHVVQAGTACLIELDGATDDQWILDVATNLIQPRMPDPQLVRPTDYFHPSMSRGIAVDGPLLLVPETLPTGACPVFLDLRNICRENTAIVLPQRTIANEDLAHVLGVYMEAIDGYFLAIKGGRRRGGYTELWPGCVLRADVLSVAEVMSDDSSLSDNEGNGPGDREHSGHFNGSHSPRSDPDTEARPSGGSPGQTDQSFPDHDTRGEGHGARLHNRPTSATRFWLRLLAGAQIVSPHCDKVDFSSTRAFTDTENFNCSMWNFAEFGRDVLAQDRREDTSAVVDFHPTWAHCPSCLGLQMQDLQWAVQFAFCTKSSTRACFLASFWLVGSTSYSEAVILPTADEAQDDCRSLKSLDDLASPGLDRAMHPTRDGCGKRLLLSVAGLPTDNIPFLDDAEHLETLLEQAKGESFLRVCQGLVWMFQAFDGTSNATGGDGASARCISLQQLLPTATPCNERLEASAKLGLDPDILPAFFEAFDLQQLSQDLEPFRLPDHARRAVMGLPLWDGTPFVDELCVYTDGSHFESDSLSGWAALFLVRCYDTWHFAGCNCGRIQDSPFEAGVRQLGFHAFSAEIVALLVALAFCGGHGLKTVEICYDAMSAANLVLGNDWPSQPLQSCIVGKLLAKYVKQRGVDIKSRHVKAHNGSPFNDFVDVVAKHAARTGYTSGGDMGALAEILTDPYFMWLWWHDFDAQHPGVLPCFDSTGSTVPVARHEGQRQYAASDNDIPGIPSACCSCTYSNHGKWDFSIVTYNTLSLCSAAQRVALLEQFRKAGISVVGLQETRRTAEPVDKIGPFTVFASAPIQGHEGCQIWVNTSLAVGVTADGHDIRWDPDAFTIWVSEPRLLIVFSSAGGQKFALVSAHAPVSGTPQDSLKNWWQNLTGQIRRIPRRFRVILCIDANAKFTVASEAGDVASAFPEGNSADLFRDLLYSESLQASDLLDTSRKPVVTWVSPNGHASCIDYVAVSIDIAHGLRTIGDMADFSDCFDFDHKPLQVALRWATEVEVRGSHARFDRKAMQTDWGKAKLAEIFESAPLASWTSSADEYAKNLNDHLYCSLQQFFAQQGTFPRQPYVSDETWTIVRTRRNARRVLFRCKTLLNKTVLHAFMLLWKGLCERAADFFRRKRQLDLTIARQVRVIARLNRVFRSSARHDAATGVRKVFHDARDTGQAAMCSLMRSILKMGRRFRPAKQAPVIVLDGVVHSGREEALPALAKHFAEAERAERCRPGKLRQQHGGCDLSDVPGSDVPDVAALAFHFARLKRGKAAGLSCIPAEAYSGAPMHAALAHYPILLRQVLRADAPLGWLGGRIAPIPKPGKPPTSLAGWRSILLLDPAHKAVARAMRSQVLAALDKLAHPAQCGGRKGLPLELPKTYVRTQLAWLCARHQSGSILFIDGRNAYYSAVRNLLHTDGGFGDGFELLRFVEAVFTEEEDRRCLYTALVGPGILAESCATTPLHNYIRSTVDKTWFSLDLGSGACYRTLTGTSPGAPLADVLYQLISTRFLDQVKCALEATGHITTADNGATAPMPGWADDYAVLLEAASADAAVRQLQEVVPHIISALKQTGVEMNLTKGKTEALLVLRGNGSRRLQQEIHNDHSPGIDFRLPNGQQKRLIVARKYVHLGGIVTDTSSLMADLRQIIGDAERIFSRLRRTLLSNRHLSCDERVHLFHSLVLSKVQQGAMTWFLRTGGEYNLLTSALDRWHRSMIGPIFGCSARGSDSQEIRTILGTLSAQQILDIAHVRWLAGVAGTCCGFLSRRLCQHGRWLKETQASMLRMFQICPKTSWQNACSLELSAFLHWASGMRQALSLFASHYGRTVRRQLLANRERFLAVFRARTSLFVQGGAFGRILHVVKQLRHCCSICGDAFGSKAARASHYSKVHGQAGIFSFVQGSLCMSCGMEFHTTARLRLHLRKVDCCGNRHLCADISFLKWEGVEDSELQQVPAVAVPFVRPFWAFLSPARTQITADVERAVSNEVLCYHRFRGCNTFQSLVQTVLSIARHTPSILEGAGMALCAVPFQMSLTEEGLIRGLIQASRLGESHQADFGHCRLLVSFDHFCYGPSDFNFQQLGKPFSHACA